MRHLRYGFCILLAALLCVPPVRGTAAAESAQTEYDGFLVVRQEGAVSLFSEDAEDLEPVAGDIFWTADRAQAEELLASGWASYMEPNYYATLFDTDTEEDPLSRPDRITEPETADEPDHGTSYDGTAEEPDHGASSDGTAEEPDHGASSDEAAERGWAWRELHAEWAEQLSLNGRGVRIGVIDSGVDPENPNLRETVLAEGYDYLTDTTEMRDTVSHGTKVIQMIAGDDNGLGVTGLARKAEIVPLRCFSSSNNGSVKVLARAVMDAVDLYHCDVINMSWGLSKSSDVLRQAVLYAYRSGVILTAAVGNVSAQYRQGTELYPACYDEVIGVGAADEGHHVADLSLRNRGVYVCAPGTALPLISATGKIRLEQGTSFAAPCAAAAAALLKQLVPSVAQDDFAALLMERSEDLGEPGMDLESGFGFLRLDFLFQSPWVKCDTAQEQDDPPALYFTGWIPEAGFAASAAYDGDGRLTGTAFSQTGPDAFGFTLKPDLSAGEQSVSLFLFNRDMRPLFSLQNFLAEPDAQ